MVSTDAHTVRRPPHRHHDRHLGADDIQFKARGVVFSASVMGSVPLLMKCKQEGRLPNVSDRLGDYVRANSESILSVDSADKSVDWNDQITI